MNIESSKKIKGFKDLETWKEAHKLVLMIYKITEKFPNKEQFSLTSQIRRAVVSVSSNIAEGFGRRTHADKAHFYYNSLGSLYEVESQIMIAKDLKYVPEKICKGVEEQALIVSKLLHGLIKKTNSYIQDSRF